MNHVFARQVIGLGNLGVAGFAAIELNAFFEQSPACSAVNSSTDPSAVNQGVVGCVDDSPVGNVNNSNIGADQTDFRVEKSRTRFPRPRGGY